MRTGSFGAEQGRSVKVAGDKADYFDRDAAENQGVFRFFCPVCKAAVEWIKGCSGKSVTCWKCSSRTNGWLAIAEQVLFDLMLVHGFESEDEAFDFAKEKSPSPIIN